MNVDEARVPNVDADWSIEIFLFSNGQQFSPPRKYYLRADELNSWEATLSHLATSHYGLQCPRISLFTTDGQLVEGPLGLNGGQAYVAVVEPDRFVDTGYQKYLIRASRSWEKRQARKKVTECVPGDPCCLCPEKEWCCDPQTCCECLEKEDSYSQFLPVSEQLEFRPADGHYMNPTPTKSVTTGDNGPYGPRSGGITPTAGEHELRLGEYETSPAEYGYSPVPAAAKPDQYEAEISVNGANPAEQSPKFSGNGPRPDEYRVRSDESGTKLDKNTGRPGEYEVNLRNHSARFNESGGEPGEYGAKLNEHGSRLSQNGKSSVVYSATLSENEPRLSKDVVKSGVYGARPGKNVPRPADYETRPSRNGARPDERGAKPGEYGAKLEKNVAKPGEHETKPSQNGVRADEYGARPGAYKPKLTGKGATPDKHGAKSGEYETRSNRNEARPGERGAKPGEHKSRPSINRAKPREYVPRASEYKPRSNANGDKLIEHGDIPSENETRPSVNRDQSGEYETKPGEYAARPSEYETRPSVNRVRPGEHEARPGEHETRLSINRAKPGDSGARPGKNKDCSGEDVVRPTAARAEIEHTRRISAQREIQQGGRTGEPTRELEHSRRVSEQKGRESNLAGRPGGQRVKGNGARLSEQKNKLSDLLPRLDGRERIFTDLEARPGDHGLRTTEHDTSLENPASRVTEPSSRMAAPVSRPSPRDRINSRVRTSDLGQPKSRTPTSVDETAARLDDSVIKNTVGHPGARPGSAGGTAVTGALHISEAQQHARRSSLFAGRPSTEKKRLPIGQNSSLLKKPTLISSVLRKLEDKKPINTKQDILTKKTNEKANVISVQDSTDVLKSKTLHECSPIECTPPELPLPTISVINQNSLTTNEAPLENILDETDVLIVSKQSFYIKDPESETTASMRLDSVKHFVDAVNISPKETQTEIIYVGNSIAPDSINVEVQTNTEAVDAKQQTQRESASNKVIFASDTFQTSTETVDTKQHAQEKPASNKAKVDSDTFQHSTEAVDTKPHVQEESASNKASVDPDTFQYSTEAVDTKQHEQEEFASNNAKVDPDIFQCSTEAVDTKPHEQEESVSNIVKVDPDTFQYSTEAVDTKQHEQEESASNKAKVDSDTFQTSTEAVDTKQHEQEESASNIVKVDPETFQYSTEAVDTKQHEQEESASNKAKVDSDTFQTSTEAVDTKQHGQKESASYKAKVDSNTFQYSTEAGDIKPHEQEESASNKASVDPDTFQYSTKAVDTKHHGQKESAINKAKVDSDTSQYSTEAVDIKPHEQEESASNKASFDPDTFHYRTEVVDPKQHEQEESASNNAKVDPNTFQYSTEPVDTKQHAQEQSANTEAKVDPDTCLCSQRDRKLATVDPDENTIPILNQGVEGTINLKLDINIRNIVKSVYSCQKNCQGVRSVTNIMTSEKESQISIEDNFLLYRDSLNSLFHKNYSRGYGFDFSPNVMVVQCAGCGRLNNTPGCDPPQCCDNNKKYFVLLTNSVNEDMDESCNCNPPCCPSDLRQTQLKRQSRIGPVKKSYSDMTLDTTTTVTVSGLPLQNREMKKCNVKNSSCQTEETHECMISKHKVSITEESVTTPTSEIKKKNSSSSVSLTAKRSRLKIIQEICPEIKEHEGSLVCSQTDPVPCEKVPSACTKVSSHTCPKEQSSGYQQTCPLVQTQGCSPASSTCPSCYAVPLASIQIQTHVCPHGPQVSNMETQTQWNSVVLQARLHCDGRYSFHLPPLNVFNNFPF